MTLLTILGEKWTDPGELAPVPVVCGMPDQRPSKSKFGEPDQTVLGSAVRRRVPQP